MDKKRKRSKKTFDRLAGINSYARTYQKKTGYQAQVPNFAGAYSSLGGIMISYYQDTQGEYRGGCRVNGGQVNFKKSQWHIHQIAKRSCMQHSVCNSGGLCPNNGGSSE